MKAIRHLALPALLLALAAPADDIQPGSWTIEMSLAMAGEPPAPAPSNTVCLKSLDDMVNAGTGCSAHTTSTSGAQVSMSLSCNVNGLKMNGTGSFTVAPTKVDGTLNVQMQMADDQPVQSLTTLHASRVGDCQK